MSRFQFLPPPSYPICEIYVGFVANEMVKPKNNTSSLFLDGLKLK